MRFEWFIWLKIGTRLALNFYCPEVLALEDLGLDWMGHSRDTHQELSILCGRLVWFILKIILSMTYPHSLLLSRSCQ